MSSSELTVVRIKLELIVVCHLFRQTRVEAGSFRRTDAICFYCVFNGILSSDGDSSRGSGGRDHVWWSWCQPYPRFCSGQTNSRIVIVSAGALVFEPASVTISKGDTVTWTNNAGFPHNIVFDEDAVPAGVNADALSNEDYLNAPGETVTRKFDVAGEYNYYCEPHQGAGMQGKVIVN